MTFRYVCHTGWNTSKIILWLISLGFLLGLTPANIGDMVQREHQRCKTEMLQVPKPQVQVQVQVPDPQVQVQVQVLGSQVQVQVLKSNYQVQPKYQYGMSLIKESNSTLNQNKL